MQARKTVQPRRQTLVVSFVLAMTIAITTGVASCSNEESSPPESPDCRARSDEGCICSVEEGGNGAACEIVEPGVCCASSDWPTAGDCTCYLPGGTCTFDGENCSCYHGNEANADEYTVFGCPESLTRCCADDTFCSCDDSASPCLDGKTRVAACPIPECPGGIERVSSCN
jgi:hypothetical protein